MAPLYEEVCAELGCGVDSARLAGMRAANEKRLAELEEKITDAGGCCALYVDGCREAWGGMRRGPSGQGWVGKAGRCRAASKQLWTAPVGA